jgi:hypothetical protein
MGSKLKPIPIPHDLPVMSTGEVAQILGVKRQLVYQAEQRALHKLRKDGRMKQLLELAVLRQSIVSRRAAEEL